MDKEITALEKALAEIHYLYNEGVAISPEEITRLDKVEGMIGRIIADASTDYYSPKGK